MRTSKIKDLPKLTEVLTMKEGRLGRSQGAKVRIQWDLSDEAKAQGIFRLIVSDYEESAEMEDGEVELRAYVSKEELLAYLRGM